MGCAGSKDGFPSKDSRRKQDLVETKYEKINEDLTRPEKNSPRPRNPRDRKDHIYTHGGYSELEYNARMAELSICLSWHAFTKYLTQGMTTDIEKVRSMFVWMGCQNFISGNIPNGKENSPLSYMRMVKNKTMTYAAFFVKICRVVGLKAVLIKGVTKSIAYDVGDSEEELKKLRNSWCAVYVSGDWRFVFPLWAYSAVEDGKMSKSKISKDSTVGKFNEFFFLTDPDVFVHFAFPDDPDWQLLTVPLTFERFLQEPYYRQPYFDSKLHLPTLFPGIHRAKHGIIEIMMKCTKENWTGNLTYQLFFNKEESTDTKMQRKMQNALGSWVLMERFENSWKFVVRFPINGVYKLTINGGVPPNDKQWMCDFKLICETGIEDIPPLPCYTGAVGWGPSNILERSGIVNPSQKHGTILSKLRQRIHFGFSLTQKLLVRSELVAIKYKPSDLEGCVEQRVANRELSIYVRVPGEGDFALRIYAKEKKKDSEKNVCNYLVTTDDPRKPKTYKRENAFERNLRRQMVMKSQETKDPDEIGAIIDQFDKLALEDKGDLKKAKNRRDFLRIRKDLADATTRRHYGTLDSAIRKARESKFESKLKATTKKAEAIRDEVYCNWIHNILEMKPSTVAELKAYNNPLPAIFDTMKAVYLLLGVKIERLHTWEDVHALLTTIGNDSLLYRVQNFKTPQLRESALDEAEKLIDNHDLNSIKSKSPAAGTFYVWVRDLVGMIKDERNNPKRKKKKKDVSSFSGQTSNSAKSSR